MLIKLKIWFRDWRRGYTDQDAKAMTIKVYSALPGEWIPLTKGEFAASKARHTSAEHMAPCWRKV